MNIPNWLIAFIVFSLVVVAGVFVIKDINKNYSKNIDTSDFNNTYNTIDTMYNISQDMKGQTIDADVSEGESWDSMTKGSYGAARLSKNTFQLFGDIINDISQKLHIPSFFIKFALAAMTIAVIFGIIYLFLRIK